MDNERLWTHPKVFSFLLISLLPQELGAQVHSSPVSSPCTPIFFLFFLSSFDFFYFFLFTFQPLFVYSFFFLIRLTTGHMTFLILVLFCLEIERGIRKKLRGRAAKKILMIGWKEKRKWKGMRELCFNPNFWLWLPSSRHYGGGCNRWRGKSWPQLQFSPPRRGAIIYWPRIIIISVLSKKQKAKSKKQKSDDRKRKRKNRVVWNAAPPICWSKEVFPPGWRDILPQRCSVSNKWPHFIPQYAASRCTPIFLLHFVMILQDQ